MSLFLCGVVIGTYVGVGLGMMGAICLLTPPRGWLDKITVFLVFLLWPACLGFILPVLRRRSGSPTC